MPDLDRGITVMESNQPDILITLMVGYYNLRECIARALLWLDAPTYGNAALQDVGIPLQEAQKWTKQIDDALARYADLNGK